MTESTQQPAPQPTPVKDDANASAAQLHQRAAADYKAGAPARNEFATQLRRGLTAVVLAVAAVTALTACSNAAPATKPTPSAAPAPKPKPVVAPPTVDTRELTEVAVDMTWTGSTEQAKTDMCNGVDMFGTDWAAQQLRTGGGTDSELDWDHAAELISDKCALR